MKTKYFILFLFCMIIALTSCGGDGGGGGGSPLTFTTTILSDPALDGDIALGLQGDLSLIQGDTEVLFAGNHPGSGDEYRAFINFPLGGAGGVPINAIIVSATLDILIDGILPLPLNNRIPILIDLVSYEPPLIGQDFDRALLPALVTTSIFPPVSELDLDQHITIDVTPLMQEAQRLGLAAFQIRLLQDPGALSPGLIVINDTIGADREFLAPLLEVTYF